MNTLIGTELHPEDRKHALSAYVHRFTKDHTPQWAKAEWKDGKPYPVQFASDADWLAHSEFYVKPNNRLDHRVDNCISHPTWPDNPELRKA